MSIGQRTLYAARHTDHDNMFAPTTRKEWATALQCKAKKNQEILQKVLTDQKKNGKIRLNLRKAVHDMALKDNTPRGSSLPAVSRNWELQVYPESCPNITELVNTLESECQYLLSPVHDMDFTEDGQPKKAHHHLYVFFKGNKSYKQMQELSERFNSKVPPKRVGDKTEAIKYSCHKNAPKKAQYSPDDIISNLEDVENYFQTAKQKREKKASVLGQIREYAQDHLVCDLADLIDCLCDEEQYDILAYVEDHTYLVKTYIEQKSSHQQREYQQGVARASFIADSLGAKQEQIITTAVWQYLNNDGHIDSIKQSLDANKYLIEKGKIHALNRRSNN